MNPLRILIVEDYLIEAHDIKETLERAGHVVTGIARTYNDALQQAHRCPPDLALIDIKLEGSSADCIHTADELRKRYDIPVLFLTANSEHETFQRAQKTVPAAYLLKPFRQVELVLQVELAYMNRRVGREAARSPLESNELFLPINGGYERIDKTKVTYLKAMKAYTGVYVVDRPTPHVISMNLGNLEPFFADPFFHKLSRSVLINLHYLDRVEYKQIVMRYHTGPLALPENNRVDLMKKITLVRTRQPGR